MTRPSSVVPSHVFSFSQLATIPTVTASNCDAFSFVPSALDKDKHDALIATASITSTYRLSALIATTSIASTYILSMYRHSVNAHHV